MPEIENPNIIRADPSKTFFIEMLTRDIRLQECILDLVDNSIHNLIRATDLDVMQILLGRVPVQRHIDASVKIDFSDTEFRIEDTCGGITVEDARNEVFLFGHPKKEKGLTGLGVYGIGMKRALFKLGRVISVESTTDSEEFRVDIDVDEWEMRPAWDFEFTYARVKQSKNGKRPGTTITVRELNAAVGKHLDLVSFQTALVSKLSAAYALFLQTGLSLKVNNAKIAPRIPELLESGELKPVRRLEKFERADVLIVAGITPRSDRDPRGWYIFCNGRMVVEADKTELTGWGENNFPQFHSKYNHFLGMVYFRSQDLQSLPWTTTKEGVEKESPIYQWALGHMRLLAKPITDFLNRLYPQDKPMDERPEFEVIGTSLPVSVEKVAKSKNSVFTVRAPLPRAEEKARISYLRPVKEIEKVRKTLRKPRLSNKEVGEQTFDYYIRKECP